MGISASVGTLAWLSANDEEGAALLRQELAAVNAALAQAGLPAHVEPQALPATASRDQVQAVPYSFIHHLRRVYAHRVLNPGWMAAPVAEGTDLSEDAAVEEVLDEMASHLVCHSDAEGFYVPIDFDDVLLGADGQALPGGLLGSSLRLRAELIQAAPALAIQLADGVLSDTEAARINGLIDTGTGLHRELATWLMLFEAARLSIEHSTVIRFS